MIIIKINLIYLRYYDFKKCFFCVFMCFLPFFHLLKTSEIRLKHVIAELLQRRGRPTIRSEEVLGASEIKKSQSFNVVFLCFCVSSIENLRD